MSTVGWCLWNNLIYFGKQFKKSNLIRPTFIYKYQTLIIICLQKSWSACCEETRWDKQVPEFSRVVSTYICKPSKSTWSWVPSLLLGQTGLQGLSAHPGSDMVAVKIQESLPSPSLKGRLLCQTTSATTLGASVILAAVTTSKLSKN